MSLIDKIRKNKEERFSKIQQALNKSKSSKTDYVDERFWNVKLGADGKGEALIRFLPGKGDGIPWAKYFSRYFQSVGGVYAEKCLTSIGKEDPVAQKWAETKDTQKDLAKLFNRKVNYVANILVIKDPAFPENEGKVFLYKFGQQIFKKLEDAANPESSIEEVVAIDPFDLDAGANFKLVAKAVSVNGRTMPNYDTSAFSNPSKLNKSDKELEEILNKQYDLSEFTDPKSFKSYDELKAKLEKVLGNETSGRTAETVQEEKDDDNVSFNPVSTNSSSDDDTDSYLESLIEED